MAAHATANQIELWPIDKLVFYARNPRKNDAAVDRMCGSIREFGFKIPVLARSDGEVVDGHLRLKAARKLGITEIPVILCDEWTPAQVKAFRLMVNRSVTWADWDEELLALELQDLKDCDFDLSLTGFDPKEIDDLLAIPDAGDQANVSRRCPRIRSPGRATCGSAGSTACCAGTRPARTPWRGFWAAQAAPDGHRSAVRDRARLRVARPRRPERLRPSRGQLHEAPDRGPHRHHDLGDTRADWSEAFALVPSLQVAYVWHASKFTREVLDGLLRIGFLHHQQIIWNKGRTVLTRTHYWFQHEPCWYVRKKNAPWFGKAGENSTIWDSPSPKFIMGGSDEEKFDHPTQKPVELMRRPILNHTKRGELVYEPFLGSGTTLAAAELTERVCYGMELDPKYVDVVVQRWQALTGKQATLDGDGRTFEEMRSERITVAAGAM